MDDHAKSDGRAGSVGQQGFDTNRLEFQHGIAICDAVWQAVWSAECPDIVFRITDSYGQAMSDFAKVCWAARVSPHPLLREWWQACRSAGRKPRLSDMRSRAFFERAKLLHDQQKGDDRVMSLTQIEAACRDISDVRLKIGGGNTAAVKELVVSQRVRSDIGHHLCMLFHLDELAAALLPSVLWVRRTEPGRADALRRLKGF